MSPTGPAPAVPPSAAPREVASTGAEPPARLLDLVAAEWIKVRSLRSTWWLLGLVALVALGSTAVALLSGQDGGPYDSPPPQFLRDTFNRTGYMTLMAVAGAAGVMVVASEYGSGLIRTTTVAVPARGETLLAKATVLTALWAAAGAALATGSLLLAHVLLRDGGAAVGPTHPGAFRALAASALVAPVCALIGLALGTLIRHGGATMVVTLVTLLALPSFFATTERWSAYVNHAMPFTAWDRLTETWPHPSHLGFHPTVAGSWAVYLLWPLLGLALAWVVIRRRDV